MRGTLAPPGVPLHRTRAEQFDDLVLQAVTRLEPRWEAHLTGVEFAVEEIPPAAGDGMVLLGRLDVAAVPGEGEDEPGKPPSGSPSAARPQGRPPRIVVYRRPLMARAEGDDELADLVFEVIVEEFARLLGIEPEDVDPGYSPED